MDSLPWESGVRSVCGSSADDTKQFIAALSAADLEALLFALCPLPSIPESALWGSSVDRKSVHAISHVSSQFAFYIASQSPPHVPERPVKLYALLLHSRVLIGLSFEGINSAANRWFHLANKHNISVFHCTLPPPCWSTAQPRRMQKKRKTKACNKKYWRFLAVKHCSHPIRKIGEDLNTFRISLAVYPSKLWPLLLAIVATAH